MSGITVALMLAVTMAAPVAQQAEPQTPRPRQGGPGRGQVEMPAAAPGMPIQQLQELFDAFVLVQAQRVLNLTDEEYQQFFPRMKRLQDTRRQQVQQRTRLLADLRRAYAPLRPGARGQVPPATPAANDAALAEMLERVQAFDSKADTDARAVRQTIDDVLSLRQRAAFRLFEEDMERQKLDFITRARQAPEATGAGRGGRGGGSWF